MGLIDVVRGVATSVADHVITLGEIAVGQASALQAPSLPRLCTGPQRPVIFVGGIGSTPAVYQTFFQSLHETGFQQVYVSPLVDDGYASIEQSAANLEATIDRVMRETGATSVDVVAHSEGGLIARYALEFGHARGKIAALATLDTPHLGVGGGLVRALGSAGSAVTDAAQGVLTGAAAEMVTGSPFMTRLNAAQLTAGTRYLFVSSTADGLVSHASSAGLPSWSDTALTITSGFWSSNHFAVVARNPQVSAALASFFTQH